MQRPTILGVIRVATEDTVLVEVGIEAEVSGC